MEPKPPVLDMATITPFGPPIIKVKLPEVIINEMNAYVDLILADEQKALSLDHGSRLAGNVHQEILLEPEFMKRIRWVEFIGWVCNEWLKKHKQRELKSINIIHSWIVRQFQNEYNPVHHHSGHISGVAYLKIPRSMGEPNQSSKVNNSNGKLVFIHGSPNVFSNASIEIQPEVGDFYLFPNHLQHAVYPFTGTDEERRSVSFNAVLDPDAAAY